MKSTWGNRLSLLFGIQPGEGRLVSLLLAHSFWIGLARIFTRTAALTLFLVQFDAQKLPYTYIGVSIIATLISLAYLKLGERLSFSNLLIANLCFLLLTLIGFRLGLELSGAGWLVFALPIWYEVLWTLTNLEFWNLTGRLFNVRQAKRLFGLVCSGEEMAILIGGLLVPILLRLISTADLLLMAALAVAGALGFLLYITRSFAPSLIAPVEKAGTQGQESTASLLRNFYILSIYGLFALGMVGFFFIDNIFYFRAEVQYPGQNQLAGFIGVFFGALALLTLFSKALLASPMVSRYGVRIGLLVTPAILAIVGVLAGITGVAFGTALFFFWLVAATKLLSVVFVESINVPVLNILYQPLSAALRVRAQTAVEGLVYPISIGLAGLVLALLTTLFNFGALQLIYILLFILVAWIVLAIWMSRGYQAALVQALAKRKLDGTSLSVADRSSVAILQQALHSPHVGAVVYALDMLEAIEYESLPATLEQLLAHEVPEVRQDVLGRIERLGLTSALPAVEERVRHDPNPRVRGCALRTMAALGEAGNFATVSAYLDDSAAPVRQGAMVGLLRSGGIEGVLASGHKLLQMVGSSDPAERVLAAQVLGEVGVGNFYQPLIILLGDNDPQVWRAALLAAGRLRSPKLWPLVIEGLGRPQVRGAAVSALVAGGQSAVPELRKAFTNYGQNREILTRLAAVCGRIGGDEVAALLKERMNFPGEGVRTQVLRSLSRCGCRAEGEEEVKYVHDQIETELAQAAWTLAALVDIDDETQEGQAGSGVPLLQEALLAKLDGCRARLFLLLSFVYDAQSILRARDNLGHALAENRAYALEVLDVLVSKELKRQILPLLGEMSPDQQLAELNPSFPQPRLGRDQRLKEIIAGRDEIPNVWLKACALFAVGGGASTELREAVLTSLSSPHALVRETAVWALWKLDQGGYRGQITELRHDPSPVVARAVQHLEEAGKGDGKMLSTIEKVIILKTVGIFAETPDDILVEVATLLEEAELKAGETIFEKGDLGDCLYIIADGEVRVHDGERTLNHLGRGDVFGEMALLDPEPRVASVTALEETRLLRLDQEPFYELMDDRIEVVRGIIRVLSGHLRARVKDLNELRTQLEALSPLETAPARGMSQVEG